jgi:hypothetical protein
MISANNAEEAEKRRAAEREEMLQMMPKTYDFSPYVLDSVKAEVAQPADDTP